MNQPPREKQKGHLSHLKELNMTKVRSSDVSTECPHPQELSKALSEVGNGRGQGASGCKRKGLLWERGVRNKDSYCYDSEERRERDSGMIRSHFANRLE